MKMFKSTSRSLLNVAMIMSLPLCGGLFLSSCDDFLDITPTGKVIPTTGEEFRDLMTNAYNNIPNDRGLTCLRSDEVQMPTGTEYATSVSAYLDIWNWNDDAADDATTTFSWRQYYHVLYMANYVIEHKGEITNMKEAELRQLVGEAYMMRAYMHFTLANLFAQPYTHCDAATTRGVPLKTNSDVGEMLACSTVKQVYDQVVSDLDAADTLLNVSQWPKGETYRWNTLSATCLRARVLLYMGRYDEALALSEAIVQEHPALQPMNGTLLPNHYTSDEAIASTELVITAQYNSSFWVNRDFVNLYRAGDYRKTKYFKAITASTYTLLKAGNGNGTEQSAQAHRCTFRSAEFYLTAAECALRVGNRDKALQYYEALMDVRYQSSVLSRYKTDVESMDDDALLDEILLDRARELAFEGHRWFDLRRTTRPALSKTYRGVTYELEKDDSRYTLRIPAEAIAANPLLAE